MRHIIVAAVAVVAVVLVGCGHPRWMERLNPGHPREIALMLTHCGQTAVKHATATTHDRRAIARLVAAIDPLPAEPKDATIVCGATHEHVGADFLYAGGPAIHARFVSECAMVVVDGRGLHDRGHAYSTLQTIAARAQPPLCAHGEILWLCSSQP